MCQTLLPPVQSHCDAESTDHISDFDHILGLLDSPESALIIANIEDYHCRRRVISDSMDSEREDKLPDWAPNLKRCRQSPPPLDELKLFPNQLIIE